jgi:hypothetical protein
MRALPVADPGTPDLRSPARHITWLTSRQKGPVALGVLWGCVWMVAQALAPAAIGAAIDGLVARQTWPFTEPACWCWPWPDRSRVRVAAAPVRGGHVPGRGLPTVQLITGRRPVRPYTGLVTTGEVVSVNRGRTGHRQHHRRDRPG